MTASFAPATIAVHVSVENGIARAASVLSGRERLAEKLFVGRLADDVPPLAARVFALCPMAQSAVAAAAIAAARGQSAPPGEGAAARAAERAAESLRAAILGWPLAPGETGPDAKTLAALREALTALRALGEAKAPLTREPIAALRRAGKALGLPARAGEQAGGWFAAMAERLAADETFSPRLAVACGADDDEVFAELAGAEPPAPRWARAQTQTLAERAVARAASISEMIEALASLHEGVGTPEPIAMRPIAEREGAAAVAAARGRLYHRVALSRDGHVARYAMLAPTDRAFAPQGPFLAALVGAGIGGGDMARVRVARLAASFDPCVALRIIIGEDRDA